MEKDVNKNKNNVKVRCDKGALIRNEMTGETDVKFVDEYIDFHGTRSQKRFKINQVESKIGIEDISMNSFDDESVLKKSIKF